MQRATRLEDVYKVVDPAPLSGSDLAEFYRPEMNAVRGGDFVGRLKIELDRSFGATYFRRFVMGHPGVGKSTELGRLISAVEQKYLVVRINAVDELNPAAFQPFDLLYAMMARQVDIARHEKLGGLFNRAPGKGLLRSIERWLSVQKTTESQSSEAGVSLSLGKIPPFLKFADVRVRQVHQFEHKRIADLVELMNRLIEELTKVLRDKRGREWLFVVEDFDKPGLRRELVEKLFLENVAVFESLRCHLILTIPIWLGYGEQGVQLPSGFTKQVVYDTPVFDRDHHKFEPGRAALRSVIRARLDEALFASAPLIEQLIVASGGNLRDLFQLLKEAADDAYVNTQTRIEPANVERAINLMRGEIKRRLGDLSSISPADKLNRLAEVYRGRVDVTDPVLYSLLRSKSVLEFNGRTWFGVPPLVVDLLKSTGTLEPGAPGGTD